MPHLCFGRRVAPKCHADTWVAPDANLIGKVVLEEGRKCLVWKYNSCRPRRNSRWALAAMCRKTA